MRRVPSRDYGCRAVLPSMATRSGRIGPQRRHPVAEAIGEQAQIDAVHQHAEATRAGHPVMMTQEAAQEFVLAQSAMSSKSWPDAIVPQTTINNTSGIGCAARQLLPSTRKRRPAKLGLDEAALAARLAGRCRWWRHLNGRHDAAGTIFTGTSCEDRHRPDRTRCLRRRRVARRECAPWCDYRHRHVGLERRRDRGPFSSRDHRRLLSTDVISSTRGIVIVLLLGLSLGLPTFTLSRQGGHH